MRQGFFCFGFFCMNVFLQGCATVEFPAGHLASPEVPGKKLSFEIGVGTQENRVIYIADENDEGDSTLELRESDEFKGNRLTSLVLGVGFLESMYFAFYPGCAVLQWQFLGKPQSSAQKGNLAASVFYGSGNSSLKSSIIRLAHQEKTLDGEVDLKSQIVGLNFGYRWSSAGGIGLSFFAQSYDVKGIGDLHDASGSSIVTTENVELNRKTIDYGVGIPLYGGGNFFQFLLMPTFIMIEEAVRKEPKNIFLLNARLSLVF